MPLMRHTERAPWWTAPVTGCAAVEAIAGSGIVILGWLARRAGWSWSAGG